MVNEGHGRERAGREGFTLLELIIAVAIIGIMAAVAIPSLNRYIYTSRTSEAATVIQGLRIKQAAYYNTYKRYTQSSTVWIPYVPFGNCQRSTVNWATSGNADLPLYRQLGFAPDRPTYFAYWMDTSFDAAGNFTNVAHPTWLGMGLNPLTPAARTRPFALIRAVADLDCDGEWIQMYGSTRFRDVIRSNLAQTELDPPTY